MTVVTSMTVFNSQVSEQFKTLRQPTINSKLRQLKNGIPCQVTMECFGVRFNKAHSGLIKAQRTNKMQTSESRRGLQSQGMQIESHCLKRLTNKITKLSMTRKQKSYKSFIKIDLTFLVFFLQTVTRVLLRHEGCRVCQACQTRLNYLPFSPQSDFLTSQIVPLYLTSTKGRHYSGWQAIC